MNNPEFELLVYLITSAKALPEEPASYGPLRLTEAASRLCKIICEKYPENTAYRARLDDYLVYDNNGNGTINFDNFTEEEIGKANSLINKSEKKGKNEKSILLHKIKNVDFDVLISKFSSYICSYVPLEDGTILILDIAHKTKGYDESVNILRRNLDTIKDIRNEAKEQGTERLFESQKEYRDSLRDKYGLNTSKMNEVKL